MQRRTFLGGILAAIVSPAPTAPVLDQALAAVPAQLASLTPIGMPLSWARFRHEFGVDARPQLARSGMEHDAQPS
jgi:hypothetical protein